MCKYQVTFKQLPNIVVASTIVDVTAHKCGIGTLHKAYRADLGYSRLFINAELAVRDLIAIAAYAAPVDAITRC